VQVIEPDAFEITTRHQRFQQRCRCGRGAVHEYTCIILDDAHGFSRAHAAVID
jgi:hypothetical protein